MPVILSAASAFPEHDYSQAEIRAAAGRAFAGRLSGLDRLLEVFDHARVARRQFVRPLPWYLEAHDFAAGNRVFQAEGGRLLERAARTCLERAGAAAEQIDLVIAVNSTGHAAPSLDAGLIAELGCRPQTARLPIWGLGCAGGAAGLARAFDYCLAHPQARVLVAAVETCSLTFLGEDASKKNLVAAAIFGDGAAAALVAGDEAGHGGPRITASRSHLFPDSERVMGWDFVAGGMQLVLSPRLPAIVKAEVAPLVDAFLGEQGRSRRELAFYLTHPGGARVIDAYREALELRGDELALTEQVLADHGNISSASVLVVLERWLENGPPPAGPGLLSAFGPGFSAELLLMEA
jgi:alkylresorcinol/alkylpyrone synthase